MKRVFAIVIAMLMQGPLRMAARLPREAPELNMAEIADRVGFSDSLYFPKCFKEEFGMSLTAYRKA